MHTKAYLVKYETKVASSEKVLAYGPLPMGYGRIISFATLCWMVLENLRLMDSEASDSPTRDLLFVQLPVGRRARLVQRRIS